MSDLQTEIATVHNPKLAQIDGKMVCQLWQDGEITLQKGGDLLWRRTLHTLRSPCPGVCVPMPVEHGDGQSYAILAMDQAEQFREKMIAAKIK